MGCLSLGLSVHEKGTYISDPKQFHFCAVVISRGHFSSLDCSSVCLQVWTSNRNSKEICPLGEWEMDSVQYAKSASRKRETYLCSFHVFFFSHLQLQYAAVSFCFCFCFQKSVCILNQLCPLKVRLLFFVVVVPFHMICPVYSAHGQEQSARSCWQRKHICIMSVPILPKRVVNRKEKQPVQLLQDVTRKHLWQPHPSNCCYRNFSYLYPLYDLDFS